MERITIDSNEKVILRLRRHWMLLVRDTIGTVIVGLVPFFVAPIVVSSNALPFDVTYSPAIISYWIALWLLIVWLSLAVLWTNYYLDLWILTDRRLLSLDQIGLFNRRVTAWSIEHVQEVSTIIENPLQAFFEYGTLEIQTAGPSHENARIPGISRPDKVRGIILEQVGAFKKLEETNKKQEGLLHTISHEVKGYLTKDAAALASIAEGDLGAVPEPVKHVADSALSATRKGVDTVMNILDSANLKSGTTKIEQTRFDIRRAIIEIAEEIRTDAEHKGLTFDVRIGEGSFEYVGDEAKLRRMVFRNLIDNAVRYTKQGSVRIFLAIDKGLVMFEVEDSGVGITPDDMKRLFTEGGRGEHSQAVNPESTGYGLFIAKQVVEAHGGRIWAESDGPGKGARFFITLPVRATVAS